MIKFLVMLPVAIALVLFGVANRQIITLILDPVSPQAEAFRISVPLFVFFFATLAVGIVVGSISTWFAQGRHRRAERQFRRERDRLQDECAKLKAGTAASSTALAPLR